MCEAMQDGEITTQIVIVYHVQFSRAIVPMSDPLIDLSKITPERGIQIIGFMAKKAISCVSCMGVC